MTINPAFIAVDKTFKHAAAFGDQLLHQAKRTGVEEELVERVATIFHTQLRKQQWIALERDFSQIPVKKIKTIVQKAKATQARLLRDMELDLLVETAYRVREGDPTFDWLFDWEVRALTSGNWFIKLLAALITSHATKTAIKTAKAALLLTSQEKFTPQEVYPRTQLEQETVHKFHANPKGELVRKAGVVGLRGIYRLQVNYTEKAIRKQLASFVAHEFSREERLPLKQGPLELIPLNASFDKEVERTGKTPFGPLFGQTSLSSLNRFEPHLVNGFMVRLKSGSKIVLEGFRHAILAEKSRAPIEQRRATSKQMAEELLLAPALKHYQECGWKGPNTKSSIDVVSISLVTPDAVRSLLGKLGKKINDERQMLDDQIWGLQNAKNDYNLRVTPFNFGVNAGAVQSGKNRAVDRLLGASDYQYKINKNAMNQLDGMVARCLGYLEKHKNAQVFDLDEFHTYFIERQNRIKAIQQLQQDIHKLMDTPLAYLGTGNQYEIQGRIILLVQKMDEAMQPFKEKSRIYKDVPGFKWCINCMSAKDRAGILTAVALTLADLAEKNGGMPPSVEELMTDKAHLRSYVELLKKNLESINMDISLLNTGVPGYKVGKEVMGIFGKKRKGKVYGLHPDYKEIVRLSSLTKA